MVCLAFLEACVSCGSASLCWCCRRFEITGTQQSEGWPDARVEELAGLDRLAMLILAAYEDNLDNLSPDFPEGDKGRLKELVVLKKTSYKETEGKYPPYIIAVDHNAHDVVLAVRGLNLQRTADYMTLMDNRKGKQRFDGGFVHAGLLKSAGFLLDEEMDHLNSIMKQHPGYTLTLTGHSLGSGVVCMMTLVLLKNLQELDGIRHEKIRCFAFAPPRCTSLNLAVQHADHINSIVLQDDFLPRMNYPLATIFGAYFCLPCMLSWACCVDSFISNETFIKDPRRLYPPGRLYHIVYRTGPDSCRLEDMAPDVRTAVPVDGRFEKVILSTTAHPDHLLTVIYDKAHDALLAMKEKDGSWESAPKPVKLQRMESIHHGHQADHVKAMERAKSLNVHGAKDPSVIPEVEEDGEQGTPLLEEEGGGEKVAEGHAEEEPDQAKRRAASVKKWSIIIDHIINEEDRAAGEVPERKKRDKKKGWSVVQTAVKEHKLKSPNSV